MFGGFELNADVRFLHTLIDRIGNSRWNHSAKEIDSSGVICAKIIFLVDDFVRGKGEGETREEERERK